MCYLPHRCVSSSTTPRRFSCTPDHPLLGYGTDNTGRRQQPGLEKRTESDITTAPCSRFVLAFPSFSEKNGPNERGNANANDDPPLLCPPELDATVFYSLDIGSQREIVRQHTLLTTTSTGTVQTSSSQQETLSFHPGDIAFPVPFRIPPVPYKYEDTDSTTDVPTMTTVPWLKQAPDKMFDDAIPFGGAEGGTCIVQ